MGLCCRWVGGPDDIIWLFVGQMKMGRPIVSFAKVSISWIDVLETPESGVFAPVVVEGLEGVMNVVRSKRLLCTLDDPFWCSIRYCVEGRSKCV